MRAYSQLQGSTLTPERRERVMRSARHMRIRPFEASLIIAIVQDHARSGLSLEDAHGTLALLRKPRQGVSGPRGLWLRWAVAGATAVAANALLIWWLLAG